MHKLHIKACTNMNAHGGTEILSTDFINPSEDVQAELQVSILFKVILLLLNHHSSRANNQGSFIQLFH